MIVEAIRRTNDNIQEAVVRVPRINSLIKKPVNRLY